MLQERRKEIDLYSSNATYCDFKEMGGQRCLMHSAKAGKCIACMKSANGKYVFNSAAIYSCIDMNKFIDGKTVPIPHDLLPK